MKNSDSTGFQTKQERRDASTTSPEPPQNNDRNEGGVQQSSIGPPEVSAEVPPAAKVAAPTSDGEQAGDVPGVAEQERQQVVSVADGSRRQPPALGDCVRALPAAVLGALRVGRDQDDEPFLQLYGSRIVHRLRDPGTRLILAQALLAVDGSIRPAEVQGIADQIEAYARLYGQRHNVWVCEAPNEEGGVDFDLVDDAETIARVVPGRCHLMIGGTTLFYRSPRMLRRMWSKDGGDFYRLFRYLGNLRFQDQRLVGAWVLYTLAHPKVATTVFIHLILVGPQGSGKTMLAVMLLAIISRSSVGVQALPRNVVDLAIAAAQGHLCAFDNVRAIPTWLSDLLCLMATGGVVATRTLYSNAGQSVISLHCPLMVTSLHSVITEPDLGDRSLQVHVLPLDATSRRDPAVLMREFEQDLPIIYRGALELIAQILEQLPQVEPADAQRVYRFSHWLAALERVECVPAGGYQQFYRESLGQVMLDGLHESSLSVAVLDFVERLSEKSWSGTAAELLTALNRATGRRALLGGGDWPVNEIALSRRLRASVAAFRTQGIEIAFTRGRVRCITITRVGGADHD